MRELVIDLASGKQEWIDLLHMEYVDFRMGHYCE